MIIDFTVSNYGPFEKAVTLTFEASNDEHLSPSYVRQIQLENGKTIKLLRMALLYGANAAGKTTILEALSFMDNMVTNPASDIEKELDVNPFAFYNGKPFPTSLMITFVRSRTVFRYRLDLQKEGILCESLEYKGDSRFKSIFKRSREDLKSAFKMSWGSDFKLNKAESEKLNAELLANVTALSVLNRKMTVKSEKIQQAYSWFKEQLFGEVSPETTLTSWVTKRLEEKKINEKQMLLMMNQAGIPVKGINLIKYELNEGDQQLLKKLPDEAREMWRKLSENKRKIHTVYQVDNISYELDLEDKESLGTQRYYGLAGLLSMLCSNEEMGLFECQDKGGVLPIDEIEHSLHPELLEHFLVTFLNDSSNSQLIATTHYREFLQNNLLFRNDVIWFVDKDPQTMSSDLYCLEDVQAQAGLRATSSVYNFYKYGRLGGVPKLEV